MALKIVRAMEASEATLVTGEIMGATVAGTGAITATAAASIAITGVMVSYHVTTLLMDALDIDPTSWFWDDDFGSCP